MYLRIIPCINNWYCLIITIEVHGTITPRSKELPETPIWNVFDAHQSGKGFKSISMQYEIIHSTVTKIIYKWSKFQTTGNLSRPDYPSPTKFSPRVEYKMHQDDSKNPRMSSRDLQAALGTVYVKVHESTIRKRLHKFNPHGRSKEGASAIKKAWRQGRRTTSLKNVIWTDESRLCLGTIPNFMFGGEKNFIPTVNLLTTYLLLGVFLFEAALLFHGLGSSPSQSLQWIQYHTRECLRRMWNRLSKN